MCASHEALQISTIADFATTMDYVDRQILGLLAPVLQSKIGWNELQYGYIVTAFQLAYAIGLLIAGPIMDGIGTRVGYAFSMALWSVSAAAHALVNPPSDLGQRGFSWVWVKPAISRLQSRLWPSGSLRKSVLSPPGSLNSGTNLGAAIAPLFVLRLAVRFGWQAAFVTTGLLSAIPLFLWIALYHRPLEQARLSPSELHHIQSDPSEPAIKIPWALLLRHRQTWVFAIGKFLTDPVWWFLLFWVPKFLSTRHGLALLDLGLPLVIIYNAACVGSILGGWISGRFIKRGWTVNRARKASMVACAVAIVPIIAAANVSNLWVAVALIGLAAAAHQGWSANLFTLTSDLFPQRFVGSVVGIGGFCGAIGGLFIAAFTGWVLQFTGSYVPMFVIAGCVYLLALAIIHLLLPDLKPAELSFAGTEPGRCP